MDIRDLLKGPGQVVKNPEYTGKRDKKHSPTIAIPYTQENTTSVYGDFNRAVGDYGNMFPQVKDPLKYDRYGITITKQNVDRLDTELANAQSNWAKFGNMLLQTTIGEVILGTAAATADMVTGVPHALALFTDKVLNAVVDDYKENTVQRALGMDENSFSNAVGDYFRDLQEKFNNEAAPIYSDPNINIANGGINIFSKGGFGWWMKNMPQIASTLTLLVPTKLASAGVAKAAQFAGYLAKAGKLRKVDKVINNAKKIESLEAAAKATDKMDEVIKLNRFQRAWYNPMTRAKVKAAGKLTGEALVMRTIENYQESHQTYTDVYDKALESFSNMSNDEYNQFIQDNKESLDENQINPNDKEAVAKWLAKRSADRTFLIDYSNTVFDVWQLYALKNIGKFFGKAKGRNVGREHRRSIKETEELGKRKAKGKTTGGEASTTEPTDITNLTKPNIFKRAGQNTWDFLKDTGHLGLAESTEGIEEAVNFIAQQEGLTYGNTILKKEPDASLSGFFNNRLAQYWHDPQMWESAFWGLMGGMIFGAAGSALNTYQTKKSYENTLKERQAIENENAKKEGREARNIENDLASWIQMSEMPQDKAVEMAMQQRIAKLTKLADDINILENQKRDPRRKSQDGEFVALDGDIEVQTAMIKKELLDQFISDLSLDAVNSNTYDLLTDYLSAKPVRDAMVQMGIISEEEADSFVNNTLETLEASKKIYNEEISHVNAQVAALNRQGNVEGEIPLEYVMQIAKANADARIQLRRVDEKIRTLDSLREGINNGTITEAEQQEAKRLLRIRQIQDLYGRLEANKRALRNGEVTDREGNPLTKWRVEEEVDDINRQQQALLSSLKETFIGVDGYQEGGTVTAGLFGAMLYTIRTSKAYRRIMTPAGVEHQVDLRDADFNKSDKELIKEYESVLGKTELSEEVTGNLQKKLHDDIAKIQGDGNPNSTLTRDSLLNRNSRLHDLLADIADLELERTTLRANLSHTQGQIRNAVDALHNRFSNVREEILDEAEKTIRGLHDKYWDTKREILERIIIDTFFSDRAKAYQDARNNIDGTDDEGHSDAEKLISALNLLNFSHSANRSVFQYLAIILEENNRRHKVRTSSSTNSQNPSQSQQGSQPINQSGTTPQSGTSPASGQNQSGTPQRTPTQQPTQTSQGAAPAATPTNTQGTAPNVQQPTQQPTQQTQKPKQTKQIGFTIQRGKIEFKEQVGRQKVNTVLNPYENTIELGFDAVVDPVVLGRAASDGRFFEVEGDRLETGAVPRVIKNPVVRNENIYTLGQSRDSIVEKGIIRYERPNQNKTPEEQAEDAARQAEAQRKAAEAAQAQAQGTTQGSQPQGTTTTKPVEGSTGTQPTNSPTGEVTGFDEVLDVVEDDTVSELESIKHLVVNLGTTGGNLSDYSKVNEADVRSAVTATVKSQGTTLSDAELDDAITKGLEVLKQTMDAIKSQLSGLNPLESSAGTFAYFSKLQNKNTIFYGSLFRDTLESFVKNYCKLELVPEVEDANGNKVTVISTRDVIRIVHNIKGVNDISTMRHLYDLLLTYLNSDEGKLNYLVLDSGITSFDDVIDYIENGPTNEKLDIEEWEERVEITVPDILLADPNNIMSKAFRALKKGEQVRLEREYDDIGDEIALKVIVDIEGKSVSVGRLPIAHVGYSPSGLTVYWKHNKTLLHDISKDSAGNVSGEGLDFLLKVFTDTNDADCAAIRALLVAASGVKVPTNAQLDAWGTALGNIGFIRNIAANCIAAYPVGFNQKPSEFYANNPQLFFVNGKDAQSLYVDYRELFEGLLHLWNYCYLSGRHGSTDLISDMRDSIIQWYSNLYQTYERLDQINNLGNTAEVSKITEGFINQVTQDVVKDYDSLPLINQGVAPTTECRLCWADNGTMRSSGKTNAEQDSMPTGTTGDFITVYSRNSKVSYQKILGVRLIDNLNTKPQGAGYSGTIQNIVELGLFSIHEAIRDLAAIVNNQAVVNQTGLNNAVKNLIDKLTSTIRFANVDYSTRGLNKIPLLNTTSDTKGGSRRPIFYLNQTANGIELNYVDAFGNYNKFTIYWRTQDRRNIVIYNTGSRDWFEVTDQNSLDWFISSFYSYLVDKTAINISKEGILSDNGSFDVKNGFLKHKQVGGQRKLCVDIPVGQGQVFGKSYQEQRQNRQYQETYDDYNDFVMTNNCCRVNMAIADNGTNFNYSTNNQPTNRHFTIKLKPNNGQQPSTNNINPKPGEKYYMKGYQRVNEVDSNQKQLIIEKIKAYEEAVRQGKPFNLIEELLKIAGKEEIYKTLKDIASELDIDIDTIFPKNILYNEELNVLTQEDNGDIIERGPIALVNPADNTDRTFRVTRVATTRSGVQEYRQITQRAKPDWVIVGDKWINLLAGLAHADKNVAIRTLIHERLHQITHDGNVDRVQVLTQVKAIYDEFKAEFERIKQQGATSEYTQEDLDYVEAILQTYDNERLRPSFSKDGKPFTKVEEHCYEEFMVEAITSSSFFKVMNSIATTTTESNAKETIFNKLIRLVAKLFGFGEIKDNSLYKKFFDSLRELGEGNVKAVEQSIAARDSDAASVQEDENIITDAEEDEEPDLFSMYSESNLINDEKTSDYESTEVTVDDVTVDRRAEHIRNMLPIENREAFDKLIQNGWISTKCN